eukprot:gene7323-7535_t
MLLVLFVVPTATGRLPPNSHNPGAPPGVSAAPNNKQHSPASSARDERVAIDGVVQQRPTMLAGQLQHSPAKVSISDLQLWLQASWPSSDSIPGTSYSTSSDRRRHLSSHVDYLAAQPTQQLSAAGGGAASLCSATINYGASVGDASKKTTTDVPIFVGSFDVVVMQPPVPKITDFSSSGVQPEVVHQWVLGWQFAAGEHVLGGKDVFGDPGIYNVITTPEAVAPETASEAQRVAVFRSRACIRMHNRRDFLPDAPVIEEGPSPEGRVRLAALLAEVVAQPQLALDRIPRQLLVEYLPVEFTPAADKAALFAKTLTQFYFKFFANITSKDDYSYMDTPLEPSASSSSSNSSGKNGQLIRRRRDLNPGLPLYVDGRLAWGSPPVAGAKVLRGANDSLNLPVIANSSSQPYPPGSYCQQGTAGNKICGVDMLYCCFGGSPLSAAVPADWQQRLAAAAAAFDPGSGTRNSSASGGNSSSSSNNSLGSAAGTSFQGASGSGSHLPQYGLVLAIVLPVLAAVAGLALFAWSRRSRKLRNRNSRWAGSEGSRVSKADLPQGETQAGSWDHEAGSKGLRHGQGLGRVHSSGPSILRSLLGEGHSSHAEDGTGNAAAAAGWWLGCGGCWGSSCWGSGNGEAAVGGNAGRLGSAMIHQDLHRQVASSEAFGAYQQNLQMASFQAAPGSRRHITSTAVGAAPVGDGTCNGNRHHTDAAAFAAALSPAAPLTRMRPRKGHSLPPGAMERLNSSLRGSQPGPSFFKALMATGGVIHPPNGPAIPLNVDFDQEIQPHLAGLLGKGGFGHVYEGFWRGQRVAVKLLCVDTEEPAVLDAFLKEVALCACLRGCDRIAPAGGLNDVTSGGFDSCMSPACPNTPSRTAPEGFMTAAVSAQYPPVRHTQQRSQSTADEGLQLSLTAVTDSLKILQIGLDIAAGLAYLHPAIIHRDLKPQNVLLDGSGRAKLADFGISRFKDPHRSYLSVTHQGGTPNYMAPELFNGTRVDEAADVYSLGCILYECLTRRQPFGHLAGDGKSFNMLFKVNFQAVVIRGPGQKCIGVQDSTDTQLPVCSTPVLK